MKSTKYTVTITLEMLSLDTGASLLQEASGLLLKQINHAELSHDDGDSIKISITSQPVEF